MFYFKDDGQVTVIFQNGTSGTWKSTSPDFKRVCELCKAQNWIAIETINNMAKIIMEGIVSIDGDKLKVNGHEVADMKVSDNKLVSFIYLLKTRGMTDRDIDSIRPFLNKVFENRYIDALTEIYDFCKHGDFEICEDGDILAYKKVGSDLKSMHDHKTEHKLWEYTTVDEFDTDRNNVCSRGLHFCSHDYLFQYRGDVILVVKIDPRDIVSIPTDYNYSKGRCRKYLPIGLIDSSKRLSDIDFKRMTNGKVVTLREKTVWEKEDYDCIEDYVMDKFREEEWSIEAIAQELSISETEVQEIIRNS